MCWRGSFTAALSGTNAQPLSKQRQVFASRRPLASRLLDADENIIGSVDHATPSMVINSVYEHVGALVACIIYLLLNNTHFHLHICKYKTTETMYAAALCVAVALSAASTALAKNDPNGTDTATHWFNCGPASYPIQVHSMTVTNKQGQVDFLRELCETNRHLSSLSIRSISAKRSSCMRIVTTQRQLPTTHLLRTCKSASGRVCSVVDGRSCRRCEHL